MKNQRNFAFSSQLAKQVEVRQRGSSPPSQQNCRACCPVLPFRRVRDSHVTRRMRGCEVVREVKVPACLLVTN